MQARRDQLVHDGYIALYVQLANILRSSIETGRWECGSIIPTENQLMEQYQVSRTTVREAITILVNEGLLVRRQGKGTIVQSAKVSELLGRLTGFSEEIRNRGMVPSAVCLTAEFVHVPLSVAKALGCLDGTLVFQIYRLRLADHAPIAVERSYWPEHIGKILSMHNLNAAAYYDILELEHHMLLKDAEETITAVIASTEEAMHLHTVPGAALLQMERITTSHNYGVVEYCTTRYRADRYDYRIRLQRGNS